MAAATAAREAQGTDGKLKSYLQSAAKIWKGTLVMVNATGYVAAGTDAANTKFAGVAYDSSDNSAGAAGDKACRVQKSGEYGFVAAGLAQGDVGKEVYITDDSTVQTAANVNGVKVGVITEVISATSCRVRIDGYTR